MKHFYVINLNTKRIFIVVGVLFILLSFFLWIGLKLGQKNANTEVSEILKEQNANNEEEDTNLPPDTIQLSDNNSQEINQNQANINSNQANTNSNQALNNIPISDQEELPIQPDPLSNNVTSNNTQVSSLPLASKQTKSNLNTSKSGLSYTIQLGAYARENDAIKLVKELNAKKIKARVDKGVRFYFVRAGDAPSKESLSNMINEIKTKSNLNGIIIKK